MIVRIVRTVRIAGAVMNVRVAALAVVVEIAVPIAVPIAELAMTVLSAARAQTRATQQTEIVAPSVGTDVVGATVSVAVARRAAQNRGR